MQRVVAGRLCWVLVRGDSAQCTRLTCCTSALPFACFVLCRVAALESMLEGGHEHSSLAQLTSYQDLAATCGAVFAQAAALCGVVSTHLSTKLQETDRQGDLLYALQRALKGICGSSSSSSSRGSSGMGPVVLPGHATANSYAAAPGTAAHGAAESSSKVASSTAVQEGTLRQTYAPPLPSNHLPSSATVHSTTSSSSARPNHSLSDPDLCSASTFDWDLAKQHLVQVLEYETHQYYTSLVQAAHDRPFKLDPARSMTALMFLCMLSMGVIEACQKLQSAGQAVLGCAGDGSALGKEPGQQQQQAMYVGGKPQAAAAAPAGAPAAPAGPSGTLLLLRTFLIVDVFLRIQDAFINQLPAACKSRAGKPCGLCFYSAVPCRMFLVFECWQRQVDTQLNTMPVRVCIDSMPSPMDVLMPLVLCYLQRSRPSSRTGVFRPGSRRGWAQPLPWWSSQPPIHK